QAISIVALITFPTMVGLFVLCRPFILTVYTAKWSAVIPLLKILSVAGLVQSIGVTTGWIFYSQGRTDRLFRWGAVTTTGAIASFFIGLPWGARGVAVTYTCWSVLSVYPTFAVAGSLIGLEVVEVIRAVKGVFGASVLMGVGVWGIELLIPGWGPAPQLMVGI